jgi:fructose-1,6-bisphosphatase
VRSLVEQQLKMFKVFNTDGLMSLNEIFGNKNIVEFKQSNIVGIRYDYEKNKLKYIMQNVPFTLTQQLIITSQHFVDIIEKIGSKGLRSNIRLNMELPDGEIESLKEYMFKISHPKADKRLYRDLIFQEITRLEDEFGVEIESVSFTAQNNRVLFKNNGIVFADEDSLEVAGEILS